jgi:acetyl esterase/lipase
MRRHTTFRSRQRFRCTVFLLLLSVVGPSAVRAAEPKAELLWPQGAPGAKGDKPADKPTITAYFPKEKKAVGSAVVIYPGGGYGWVATYQGPQFAKWLNAIGVTAFAVEYRLQAGGYHYPAPLQDAQRAIRIVRARAAEWKIAPDRIGALGISAGGHLASMVGTRFDKGNTNSPDPVERVSCRPDFLILCAPVIAFNEPYTHVGSQTNLLGANADPALVRSLSSEKQVTAETPPTFLFHTDEDTTAPPENSVQFYLALRRAGVAAELHIYRKGPHGAGIVPGVVLGTSSWWERLRDWMQVQGLLDRR